ncbi:MAG: ABC transporter ATP-binding protein [Herpetosiphonaceae bacterium]|nr:ABC transporter ATP-binding protein [Herpetosiphonaceae bacterium]
MQGLAPLWPYLRRQRVPLIWGFIVAALGSIVGTASPYILQLAVTSLQQQGVVAGLLLKYCALIVLLGVVNSVLNFFIRQLIGTISYTVENELRNDLFQQFMRLDQKFYGEHHTGDLMARSTNDLSAVRQMLGPGLTQTFGSGLLVVVAAFWMFSIDLRLALLALTMLPTITISFVIIGRRMRERFGHVQTQFGQISTRAQENFSGIRTIKAYAQEQQEIESFREANEEYRRLNLKYVLLNGLVWPLMSLLIGITLGLILLVGGQAVASGRITLGQFVQFNAYVGLLTWPMIALGWTVSLYQQGVASLQRIKEVLHAAPSIKSPPQPKLPAHWQGVVEMRNVGVRYGDRWIVRNISFTIPAGRSLAIVGATGAGKTTLTNLLGRVRDPSEGVICIDGIDIRELPLDELRRRIAYVAQDTFLFSVPLQENITFGRVDAGEADVERALETSQLVNDLPQFPQGLTTMLGERGVTLSGGQKQRTAIARAVLRDPTILILDDSMSSVDTHTAAEILRHLRDVMQGRTSIIIAQRIATVKDANEIIVLQNGQIAERGTHTQLIRQNGPYAAMYRRELLQSEMEVE